MKFLDRLRNIFVAENDEKPAANPPEKPVAPAPDEPVFASRPTGRNRSHLCKCIHCHKEFAYEDYLGLCTSRDCYSINIFIQDIEQGLFNPDMGPRQVLLRPQTSANIPTINEEYPIDDVVQGDNNLCPHCHSRIFFYACPHCRHPMPRVGREVFDNMIAPAGIGASGKSVYMTVLIRQLMENQIFTPNLRVISRFSEIDDLRRYEEKYTNLFIHKMRLASNQSGETPLPYLLKTTTTSNRRGDEEVFQTYTLWYDFAGELFEHMSSQHYGHRYYASVKGILFFVDPTNSPTVVQELGLADDPNNIVDNAINPDRFRDTKVMTQIQGIIEKMSDSGDIRDTFIAVIVNKVDLFRNKNFPFFRETSPIWQASPHQKEGAFSLYDYNLIKEEVMAYLQTYHSGVYGMLQSWANQKGDNIGYFAVSALGNPLVNGDIVHDIHPIRVEDPFYWLLWKLGNLPASGSE